MQLCPKCKSEEIMLDTGGRTGKYQCKKCGYVGPLIIETEDDTKKPHKDVKGKEVEEVKKKDRSVFYSLMFIVIILVILGLILVGIKMFKPDTVDDWIDDILENGETEHGYLYNGFVFVEYDGLWHTRLQRGNFIYNLHFHNSPAHVDQVPIIGNLDSSVDTSEFYITFDPLEANISLIGVAMSELSLNLVKGLGTKITPACYRNETAGCFDRPIITCSNTDEAVFFVKSGEETRVLIDKNCIVIEGPGEEIFKSVDKVLFDLYNIIERDTND